MRQYIRTTRRLLPGVSYVSYQKPGEYLVGILIVLFIGFALVAQVFTSRLVWIVLAYVVYMWVQTIVRMKWAKVVVWSVALSFVGYFAWIQSGCVGNGGFCAQLAAERAAEERTDAANRAEEHMESCAGLADWRSDPDCGIYSEQEIAAAKAKIDAREAQEAAEHDAEDRQQEAARRARLLQDRDAARRTHSVGQQ